MYKEGKIYVIGIGPGGKENMTYEAIQIFNDVECVVGYKSYIELIREMITDKEVISSGMKKEIERCELCFDIAEQGKKVAIVSSGDAGIYGMAGLIYEVAKRRDSKIEIEVVCGVTSSTAAASILGAPLMHDYAVISLSDLLTPWELIEKRVNYAAQGDFVTTIYNPKSMERTWQIEKVKEIFLSVRDKNTPVGIVRNAKRADESLVITTLEFMTNHDIDMFSTVIIGNSQSYIWQNKIITPRGYKV